MLTIPRPKPKVFVIMPMGEDFTNVEDAIREVVESLGAQYIRADTVTSPEDAADILLKTHNSIKEANVVIADRTGNRPNVMYELGFTRAYAKLLLTLSQDHDIPFNLKHVHHNFYEANNLPKLKANMREPLRQALEMSKTSPFGIFVHGTKVPEWLEEKDAPVIEVGEKGQIRFKLMASLHNYSRRILPPNFFAYLYTYTDCPVAPRKFKGDFGFNATVLGAEKKSLPDVDREVLEYRLNIALPALPSGASERLEVFFQVGKGYEGTAEPFLVRVCTDTRQFNFNFKLKVSL
jgi:hypothetical protein